jgi:polygalacturonase
VRIFDVLEHGAAGDGVGLDTAAVQRAIDLASAAGTPTHPSQVLFRGKHTFKCGTLNLRSGIDFHLADDAKLVVSPQPGDFSRETMLYAVGAHGLKISGTGTVDGLSRLFMKNFDAIDEWWIPKPFRPRLFELVGCHDLEITGVRVQGASFWAVHLMGCQRVLVDGITIRNEMDVPNCDGIDPDHCQHVEIRNCDITCGDDAIVIKATKQPIDYGPSAHIVVKDCVLATQDSGLKIGTETTQDIHDIRFERIRIRQGCRGLCIQLRDAGSVYNIDYHDITFESRYFSDPWWGRGEAISFTAIPRHAGGPIGTIHDIHVRNVRGRAENSVRVCGSAGTKIRDVHMSDVEVTLGRWTRYPGGVHDNRPTTSCQEIEPHATNGFCLRDADNVHLERCKVNWERPAPEYFKHALEAVRVSGLQMKEFSGEAAHPGRDKAIEIVK